jgi:hypothetical protein
MFTLAFCTLALAALADRGTPLFKVHSTVINRRNYDLPSAIRVSAGKKSVMKFN